jgi:hypothetical protein
MNSGGQLIAQDKPSHSSTPVKIFLILNSDLKGAFYLGQNIVSIVCRLSLPSTLPYNQRMSDFLSGTNPRLSGTNPFLSGTNPRVSGTNPFLSGTRMVSRVSAAQTHDKHTKF